MAKNQENARRQRLETFKKDKDLHGSCLQGKDRASSANRDCVTYEGSKDKKKATG